MISTSTVSPKRATAAAATAGAVPVEGVIGEGDAIRMPLTRDTGAKVLLRPGGSPLSPGPFGEPVVELVIWSETALLRQEVGGDGNAMSSLLCAEPLGSLAGSAFG